MALSSEQRTKIRETVLAGNNLPRVDNVSFAVREGTVVSGNVRVMVVPDNLVAIYPEWRGDEYFVVRDRRSHTLAQRLQYVTASLVK